VTEGPDPHGHPAQKLTLLSFLALSLERLLALVLIAVVAALFGATRQSSTYFLALIVPITLGVSTSEAFYTALLPVFTRGSRPPRALLYTALRVAVPVALAATGLYIAVLLAISPSQRSVWLAFSPILASTGLNGVYAAFLTADRRYPLAIMRVPLATGIALAFVAAVLPFWRSTTTLALGISLGQVVTLGLLAWRARTAPSGTDRTAVISAAGLFTSAAAVFAATLVGGQLVIVVERFLASGLVAGAVALLAFARGVALLPAMFAQALGSGIFPAATERFKALERESLARLALTGLRLSILAGLISTAYVVICRQELVRIAFQRQAFGSGDTRETATLVAIMAASLAGVSASATAAKTLFALGRRGLVLVISAVGVGLYVVAAVVLREVYGLDGLATAFTVASAVGGLIFTAALVPSLGLRPGQIVREWLLAPLLLAATFACGALAVWLPLGSEHPTLAAAVGTAVAVALGGLAALSAAIRISNGLEYSLLSRAAERFR
jgi:peptidoglycan biosynthesis protein MviN/MurJ (putative lipid II flippase)